MKQRILLILGGDSRSLALGEFLEKKGLQICYYAFSDTDCFQSLREAVGEAGILVLPLPLSRDRVNLNAPLFDESIALRELAALPERGQIVFGGQMLCCFTDELSARGVEWYDYFTFDELAVYNAVPTTEGVIGLLMEKLPVTVHGMHCLVAGYGRVGKVLCSALKALGADVTVAARKESDFADAYIRGYHSVPYSALSEGMHSFDALINTVPSRVITRDILKLLNPDCLLVEIASAPFGIDFQAAKELGFDCIKASSLPGKVAPKTAGEIIGKSILPILEKKGLIL